MPVQLKCAACHRRIGRRGRVVVVAAMTVFCTPCATSPAAHKVLCGCLIPGHRAIDHETCTIVTAGRAKALLNTQ